MKTTIYYLIPVLLTASLPAAPLQADYTSFLRQVQLPSGVTTDLPLNTTTAQLAPGTAASGSSISPLALGEGGARYEIYSVLKSAPMTSYKLNTAYVGVTVPQASVVIDTQDPYGKDPASVSYDNPTFATAAIKPLPINSLGAVRRTRVDKPFKVYVTTSGLSGLAASPDSQKKVDLRRQVLSYGTSNTGEGVSRTPAVYAPTLPTQFASNASQCVSFPLSEIPEIPGSTRTTVRGEEIFSVWTLNDTQIPGQVIAPNMLASQRVQIWPITTGSLAGIKADEVIRFAVPKVTLTYTNTYPGSTTYAQVYKGESRLNVQGAIVPGSSKVNTTTHSESYLTTTGADFDGLFTSDGRWTLEILTSSCFGIERVFSIGAIRDCSIKANGTFTTIE